MNDLEITITDQAHLGAKPEQLAELWEFVCAVERDAKSAKSMLKERMAEWCEVNGDLTIGETRYYAGHENETKCLDVRGALEALMHGDIDTLINCLRSDPFKPSVCREAMPPLEYDRLFETKQKPVLKEGKPKKQLLARPPAFLTRFTNAGANASGSIESRVNHETR